MTQAALGARPATTAATLDDAVEAPLTFITRSASKPVFHSAAFTGGAPQVFFDTERHTVAIHDLRPSEGLHFPRQERRQPPAKGTHGDVGVDDPTAAQMAFFWRTGADGVPASYFAEEGEDWLWPGHGVRLGDGGPLLLLPNHPNALLDPALVIATAGRPVRFLAKSTLFRGPLGPLIRASGAIPAASHRSAPPRVLRLERSILRRWPKAAAVTRSSRFSISRSGRSARGTRWTTALATFGGGVKAAAGRCITRRASHTA